jgi:DNA-binding MarR family transcriptional regulator
MNDLSVGHVDVGGALERLFDLAVVLGDLMQRRLEELGLTPARAEVLWLLNRAGPLTQRELSQTLKCTPRNVTGLVDALEAAGFVTRKPHPTDRRAALVTLTQHGQAVASAWSAEHREGAGQLFGDIPSADLAAFVATLDTVLERLRFQTTATPQANEHGELASTPRLPTAQRPDSDTT